MTDRLTHFLVWQRFQMACGKRPQEIWTSASFWNLVDCPGCLEMRAELGDLGRDLNDSEAVR